MISPRFEKSSGWTRLPQQKIKRSKPLLILYRKGTTKSATWSLFPPASWGSLAFLPVNPLNCSHKIKRHLLLGSTAITKPRQHIRKQSYHFAHKVHTVKAMVYSVVMYGCESWPIKKAECKRNNAFELWCCRRLL